MSGAPFTAGLKTGFISEIIIFARNIMEKYLARLDKMLNQGRGVQSIR